MDLTTSLVSGTTFGAALAASGMWDPSTIISQLRLTDLHMLKVFLTASSASALLMHILSHTNSVPKKPRTPSTLGTRLPYDGNIIGGVLLGFGMALTGACPGTVLVQLVTATQPGMYSFSGGLAGGILYAALGSSLRRGASCATPKQQQALWLDQKFGVSADVALLVYEAICVVVVGAAMMLGPLPPAPAAEQSPFLPPIVGGLAIGAAQLVSLILRGVPVGVSTAYEDVGAKVCTLFQARGKSAKNVLMPTPAMAFAGGVMLGAAALVRVVPKFAVAATAIGMDISPTRAVVGGLVMVFGARLAGGCTSGHGLSGMSMLATSSVVTVASMFAGGMGLASVLP
ncbi:hypothetical protein BDV95DRAFT_626108 [Massariosphaeria phaeospora]|uniref:Uncharacterized protein n=1 Tax=Massariosphaeria phaeospora TaxID=100035 RepID=A0A7C8IG59_9PLEO|nr:hypothetical protein BDV95DRAFT_626108 [Massariosphaeria phaeospora]